MADMVAPMATLGNAHHLRVTATDSRRIPPGRGL